MGKIVDYGRGVRTTADSSSPAAALAISAPDSCAIGRVRNVLNVASPLFSIHMTRLNFQLEDVAMLSVIEEVLGDIVPDVEHVGEIRYWLAQLEGPSEKYHELSLRQSREISDRVGDQGDPWSLEPVPVASDDSRAQLVRLVFHFQHALDHLNEHCLVGSETLAINVVQVTDDSEQDSDLWEQVHVHLVMEKLVLHFEDAVNSLHDLSYPRTLRNEPRIVCLSRGQLLLIAANGHADDVPHVFQKSLHVAKSTIYETIVTSSKEVLESVLLKSDLHDVRIIHIRVGREQHINYVPRRRTDCERLAQMILFLA